MMPPSPGHAGGLPFSNGRVSPDDASAMSTDGHASHSDSDLSDSNEPAAQPASDADAPGEDYDDDDDDDEIAADSSSSDDVDAEGEPDGDYDSDSPPSDQAESDRAPSSASQDSSRPSKRKASAEKDDYITQNPELYGLRRSVRVIMPLRENLLTAA
jgi:chromodomain-helicase-DNA-binding protein 1